MINSNKWEDKKLKKKFKLLDGNLSIEIDNDSYVPFISIKKAYILWVWRIENTRFLAPFLEILKT